MSLFSSDDDRQSPDLLESGRPQITRAQRTGWTALIVALLLLLVVALLPAPYVVQEPGPVFNTLESSEHDGEDVPLITISGADTYDTDGALDLLTVSVRGNPQDRPSWFQIVAAWPDPARAVVPIDSVFAPEQTAEERDEENQVLMDNSQQDAVAAALTNLGEDFDASLRVAFVADDGPANGELEQGDEIIAVDGVHPSDLQELRDRIKTVGSGNELSIMVQRGNRSVPLTLVPEDGPEESPDPAIGVGVTSEYDFPFDVDITLDEVGGPSAGMMFALGIIDKLTPGSLTGGQRIAGTGTITPDGTVGSIGGIRQKMFGAVGEGVEVFLAPSENCSEVIGNEPDGLEVFAVATLDDALRVVETVAAGQSFDDLPRCTPGSDATR